MAYHVLKFGGSNLKKKDDIQRIVDVISKYNTPLVIVVSAFYGVTNMLIEALSQVRTDEGMIDRLVDNILAIKRETLEDIVQDKFIKERIFTDIERRGKKLKRYLQGVHFFGDTPDFVADTILSYGERFSSLMLTAILQYYGVNAEEMLPENLGLITDGEYGDATVDFNLAKQSVKGALKGKHIVVVPGFYGVSKEGKVTLLGRGGSDYSAAAIAKCVQAKSLDLFKDIDGFLSADPKFVDAPRRIEKLSYLEAAELSYFGAKILHPRTVEPLQESGIPIRIYNIATVESLSQPLTIIQKASDIHDDIIKSVTFSDDIGILKLKGPGIGIKPGILSRVSSAFDKSGINIKSVITSQTVINILVETAYLSESASLTKALNLHAVNEIIAEDNISVIAVVGHGIMEKVGLAGRIFSAISQKGINIEIISVGASPVAAYFIVKKTDRAATIRAIHDEYMK
ncbi:MAG: aspartate kinase [Candidatus Marinimicrobia bacterium]|nr:aspartate kinase [Candidatus Neomarinimicrobiota bacterium]